MTLPCSRVSRLAPRLMPRFGATRLMLAGMLPVIAGMAWLAQVSAGTSYLGGILGPMLLFGTGMGVVFVPLTTVRWPGWRRPTPARRPAWSTSCSSSAARSGWPSWSPCSAPPTGTRWRPGPPRTGALIHGVASAFSVAAVFDGCALLVILLSSGSTESAARSLTRRR